MRKFSFDWSKWLLRVTFYLKMYSISKRNIELVGARRSYFLLSAIYMLTFTIMKICLLAKNIGNHMFCFKELQFQLNEQNVSR